ncbi:MAG: hypothetical protein IJL88_00565 [Clostridia bacterium]|nr:hypothetical protein [Clostridia bacterium]
MIDNASMRYLPEETEESGFPAACEEWRQAGGREVMAEYTEQYHALHESVR